jgi:type I restriction enzyme S subunit
MKQTQINKIEWKEIALGDKDYFEIAGSGIDKFTGEKEYLSTESVKGTKIEKIECKIKYNDKPSRANMQPVLNSVWFAKMQSTLKVYAFTKDNEKEINQYILSTGFAGIKILNKNISPEYVGIYLTTARFNLEKDKLCTGSTQRGINNSFIVKIKIPIPFLSDGTPYLKEQERIVKILERAEKQKEKSKKAEELLDEYLKSVFNEMFLRKNFEIVLLKQVCPILRKSILPKKLDKKLHYIGLEHIESQTGVILQKLNAKSQNLKSNKFLFDSDCILYGKLRPYLNKIALPNFDGVCSTDILPLKPERDKVNKYYIVYLLRTKKYVDRANSLCAGANLPRLSPKDLEKLKIPLPPLPLQQKFSQIVEHVEKMKENINKTKQNAKELFNSLMNKAFRGEL